MFRAVRVILAGYNIDSAVIEELKKNSPPRDDVTPETLSASYARISRDPRPTDVLRASARAEVEKARRSNQNIIFKMGHHSVAEHAVFNFDIIGLSRLAIEEVEKFRLCSYTEKSQRYIKLGHDFVIPEEVRKAGKAEAFTGTVKAQNALYHKLYAKLKPYFFQKHKRIAENPRNHLIIDGWAKEDARYIVCLATEGQLGMTANARNLEFMLRRFASADLAELRELRVKLHALAMEVAPSIILFTEAGDFDSRTYHELREDAWSFGAEESATLLPGELPAGKKRNKKETGPLGFVRLVDFTPRGDDMLLAALLHTVSSLDFSACLEKAGRLKPREKLGFIKKAFQHMEFYDFPLREFEYPDLTFDLVVSASCFAQLKRHRMATLTRQAYNPELGVTVPPSIQEIRAENEFLEAIAGTEETYYALRKDAGGAAEYILTNAHRRRALLKVNARELYHISRLREDATAQWDIRQIASEMTRQAYKVMPLTFLLSGGKDAYQENYRKVFGRRPRALPPEFC